MGATSISLMNKSQSILTKIFENYHSVLRNQNTKHSTQRQYNELHKTANPDNRKPTYCRYHNTNIRTYCLLVITFMLNAKIRTKK